MQIDNATINFILNFRKKRNLLSNSKCIDSSKTFLHAFKSDDLVQMIKINVIQHSHMIIFHIVYFINSYASTVANSLVLCNINQIFMALYDLVDVIPYLMATFMCWLRKNGKSLSNSYILYDYYFIDCLFLSLRYVLNFFIASYSCLSFEQYL